MGGTCQHGQSYEHCNASLTKISHYAILFLMANIVLTPAAGRQWFKLTSQARRRLDAKLNTFADTGEGDVKKLKGQDRYRLRVGDYRIVFYRDALDIIVVGVGHRRDIYE